MRPQLHHHYQHSELCGNRQWTLRNKVTFLHISWISALILPPTNIWKHFALLVSLQVCELKVWERPRWVPLAARCRCCPAATATATRLLLWLSRTSRPAGASNPIRSLASRLLLVRIFLFSRLVVVGNGGRSLNRVRGEVTSLSVSFRRSPSGKAVMTSVASRLQLLIQPKKLIFLSLRAVIYHFSNTW